MPYAVTVKAECGSRSIRVWLLAKAFVAVADAGHVLQLA